MNDDELRERLHAMPPPTAAIDVDAVVADARRRRRPKVVGVAVASVAGCLALLAPVVVPGLLGPDPVTATLQQSTAEEAPEGPAAPGTAPNDAAEPEASTLGEEAAGSADACATPVEAASIVDGLGLAFADDPSDGSAELLVSNASTSGIVLDLGDAGTVVLDGDAVVTATALARDAETRTLLVEAGDVASIPVELDEPTVACGGDAAGLPVSPLVVLVVDGVPTVVAGEPFAP